MLLLIGSTSLLLASCGVPGVASAPVSPSAEGEHTAHEHTAQTTAATAPVVTSHPTDPPAATSKPTDSSTPRSSAPTETKPGRNEDYDAYAPPQAARTTSEALTSVATTATASEAITPIAETPTTGPTSTPSPPVAVLQGTGEGSSRPFALEPGLAVFHFEHRTNSPFAIFLLNAQGEHLALLANASASVSGTQIFGVRAANQYHLHVMAQGDWSARIEQPSDEQLAAGATPLQPLAGYGPSVSEPVHLPKGPLRLSWMHDGMLPLEIVLWDTTGQRRIEVVNLSTAHTGEQTITIPADGVYLFDVLADGVWTINPES